MPESILEVLAALIARLDGRAAGLWLRAGDMLRLVAFESAADLPDSVRIGFMDATREVPLSRVELSIVKVSLEGEPILSLVETLPPELGSGYWLRAFGAACSLAVPIVGSDLSKSGVLSVATREVPAMPGEVVTLLRANGSTMLGR